MSLHFGVWERRGALCDIIRPGGRRRTLPFSVAKRRPGWDVSADASSAVTNRRNKPQNRRHAAVQIFGPDIRDPCSLRCQKQDGKEKKSLHF